MSAASPNFVSILSHPRASRPLDGHITRLAGPVDRDLRNALQNTKCTMTE